MAIAVAGAVLGCTNDATVAIPQLPDQVYTTPGVTSTISGTVFEHSAAGRRAAPGVVLNVISSDFAVATSDSDGRFFATVRGDVVSIVPAEPAGQMSPCPSGTTWLVNRPTKEFEVNVVSKAVLATTGLPDSYPRSAIFVSGTIVEQTADGLSPVVGALVTLGFDPFSSTTLSDVQGRYFVCTTPPGVGTDQLMPLRITRDGYSPASHFVLGAWDENDVTVELSRNR